MEEKPESIKFDRKKRPTLDFDVVPLESIFQRSDLNHNPSKLHKVQFYVLILVTDGKGKHTIDFKEYEYSQGSVLTIRKDQVHNFHKSQAKGYIFLFTEEYVLSYLEHQSAEKIVGLFNELLYNQHSQLSVKDFQSILMLVQQILEELNLPADNYTSGIIRNFLQIFINKIHRTRNLTSQIKINHKYTSQFMQFQSFVEKECHEHRAVQYYADKLHITTRTLNNITHDVINKSAKKFIDDIAVLQIKRLLINTRITIKEIAYRSGFEEPTNLFKYFKRFTGQTPESFRATYAKRS